jgi:hypothetical protein
MIAGSITVEQMDKPGDSILIPMDRFYPIYDHMIGEIGFLDPHEIQVILRAYSNLFLLPKNLSILGRPQKDELSSWMIVPAEHLPVIANMNETLLRVLDEAIACLSAEIRSPPTPPAN